MRYWARSLVGWPRVRAARPNPAHRALAALEEAGVACGLITQNVDRLHHAAGSRCVVELHGALERVRCLGCGAIADRARVQERLLELNPHWPARSAALAPAAARVDGRAGDVLPVIAARLGVTPG